MVQRRHLKETNTGVRTAMNLVPPHMYKNLSETRVKLRETMSSIKTIVGGMEKIRHKRHEEKQSRLWFIIVFSILTIAFLAFITWVCVAYFFADVPSVSQ